MGAELPKVTMKATAAPLDAEGKETSPALNYEIGSESGEKNLIIGGEDKNVTGGTPGDASELGTFTGSKNVKWTERTLKAQRKRDAVSQD